MVTSEQLEKFRLRALLKFLIDTYISNPLAFFPSILCFYQFCFYFIKVLILHPNQRYFYIEFSKILEVDKFKNFHRVHALNLFMTTFPRPRTLNSFEVGTSTCTSLSLKFSKIAFYENFHLDTQVTLSCTYFKNLKLLHLAY